MTFLHLSLLGGLLMAAAPVVIHMLTKKRPQPIVFPALRFVRQTAITAERGWKVKHWLLLALRVLLLGLLAFALAAPRVHSAMLSTYITIGLLGLLSSLATLAALVAYATPKPKSVVLVSGLLATALWTGTVLWGTLTILRGRAPSSQMSSGPICAALVIDTSPTMEYRFGNQTRLEVAKEMGRERIDRLPLESQIAIVTTEQRSRLNQDRLSALRQLDRATTDGQSARLAQRIRSAIELVRTSKLDRREVYVLTDLSAAGWRDANTADLKGLLANGDQVLLQIIDVGLEETRNWSLARPTLSQEVVLPGGSVNITAEVVASQNAPDEQVTVELLREPIEQVLPRQQNGQTVVPELRKVDQRIVEVTEGKASPVEFILRDLELGTHHVHLRLNHPDPLAIDNQIDLTIDVRAEGKVLVVSDDPELGNILCTVVTLGLQKPASTDRLCEQVTAFQIDTVNLGLYGSIVILDPPASLSAAVTEKLDQFVRSGGSVLILLGPRIRDARMLNNSPVAKLLPGAASRITRRTDNSMYFSPVQMNHPIFHELGQAAENVLWQNFPVHFHWDIELRTEGVSTLMRYTSSNKPAVIEELRGKGRILTMTTPYPEPADPTDQSAGTAFDPNPSKKRPTWNELYSGVDPWPGFGLIRGAIRYLSGWGKTQLNYSVGQPAILENDASVYPEKYQLFTPNNEVLQIESDGTSIVYPNPRVPGTYRLLGLRSDGPIVRGFSVNVAHRDMLLDRIQQEELATLIGKSNYLVAKDRDSVTSSVGQARFGRELYPFILSVIVLLVVAEQVMSSRFYTIRFGTKASH